MLNNLFKINPEMEKIIKILIEETEKHGKK
jgi:hypothetical protein